MRFWRIDVGNAYLLALKPNGVSIDDAIVPPAGEAHPEVRPNSWTSKSCLAFGR
jgi:hypothetical protein